MTRRRARVALVVACAFVLVPAIARAQSAMTGIVRDTSGAVLPGVTVEAASDALIEKSKAAVTDGEGRYLITDLRPGQYLVTFSLTGFATVRREGITLPSEFTMTLNADMRVGALEESITVTGDAPVVDVSTAVHTQVLNREAIDAIPTGRTIQGLGQLIVGVNLNLPDTGGARAMQQTYMSTHGMSSANNTVMVDGMMVNGLQGDGAIQMYFNDAMNQEVSYQTSGIGADTSAGGVRLNMIPREGGNRFSGDFKTSYRPGEWQGNNITQRHLDRDLRAGNATDRIIDFTFAQGGPVLRDKLWFFGSARYFSVNNFIAGSYFRDGRQAVDDQYIKQGLLRMTWQVTPKTKFSAYFDEVDKFRGHDLQAGDDASTAATVWHSPAYHTASAKLTNTLSSRLLVEGGWSSNLEYYTNSYLPGIEQPRGTAAWFAGASREERDIQGYRYTAAADNQTTESPSRYAVNASASYVTGSHNFKAGFQRTWGSFLHTEDQHADLIQRYESGTTGIPWTVPDSVVIQNTPLDSYGERLNYDLGIYAQDAWTIRRLTVNMGIRWERINAQVLPASSRGGRFIGERTFEAIENVPDWTDWAPRFAVVYDLFGNAKTALKYSINRYNQARTTGVADDYNALADETATLNWTDLNGDDIAQGSRGCVYRTAGCEIDFSTLPANFGTAALNEYGAYPRTWNLEQGWEIQHELLPRLSLTGSYFHGTFHNLTTTINRSYTQVDYTPAIVYHPDTGEVLSDVYFLKPLARGRATSNLDTFDPEREQIYDAYGIQFNARLGGGAHLFGGVSIARELNINCTAPDDPNDRRLCDDRQNDIPWRKGLKLAGSVPLPWGVIFSGVLQSNASPPGAGATTTRNMTIVRNSSRYPASCPAPCPAGSLIAPASVQGATSLVVPLIPFGAHAVERITQLDLKVQRTFRFGRVSVLPTLELFNVNNSDAIISYQSLNRLNAQYEAPNSIMQPRMVGVGATVRW